MNVLVTNGISKTAEREQNDYYATDPKAMELLLKHERFNNNIWEPACGEGNLSKVLKAHGYNVYSTDLIDRGYQDKQLDFLKGEYEFNGDIITNPPFKYMNEFVLNSLEAIPFGNKVSMFLKISQLSGKKRFKEIYSKFPPYRVYVLTGRIACSKNNTPDGFKHRAIDYVWMIWEKGKLGPTELKWIEM